MYELMLIDNEIVLHSWDQTLSFSLRVYVRGCMYSQGMNG